MNNFPKISIITVSYNSGATIEDTIKSVANQNYPNVEYVVVDGLSTDSTLGILKSYSDVITKVISEKDSGIYDAMNKGIAHATGDIVGLINSDDILSDNLVLQRVSEVFSDNPEIEACYGDLCYVRQNDLKKTIRYWRSKPYQTDFFNKGWVPPHPTLYIRREIYEKYGGFDLNYNIAADFELMLRFMEVHKIKTAYLPNVLVKMRLGGTTNKNIKNIILQNLEIRLALKKHAISSSLFNFMFYKVCSRFLQFTKRPQ
uniref:Glycosyl transferase family 2 n=1 Tax=Geobacter sp. (strain M21) TaxID=443144 RepID=C6E0K8_GEOSM